MLSVMGACFDAADCIVSIDFGIRVSVGVALLVTVPRVVASLGKKLFSCGTYVAAKAVDSVTAEIATAAAMARTDEERISDFINNSRED